MQGTALGKKKQWQTFADTNAGTLPVIFKKRKNFTRSQAYPSCRSPRNEQSAKKSQSEATHLHYTLSKRQTNEERNKYLCIYLKPPSFLQLTFIKFSLPLPVNSLLQLTNKSIFSFPIRKIPLSAKNASLHYQINSPFLLAAQSIYSSSASAKQQTGQWKETCLGSFSPFIWHTTYAQGAHWALPQHASMANTRNNTVENRFLKQQKDLNWAFTSSSIAAVQITSGIIC